MSFCLARFLHRAHNGRGRYLKLWRRSTRDSSPFGGRRKLEQWDFENRIWVRKPATLGSDVPLHFSRFHPTYRLTDLPPTPIETLERVRNVALRVGLHYVYMGNVPGHEGNHAYCPHCGRAIVLHAGMATRESHVVDGRRAYCQTKIAGVWQ